MPKITIQKPIDQPIGHNRLLDELKMNLKSTSFNSFRFIVAFAKVGPLLKLEQHLGAWKNRGGKIEAMIGIDEKGTSKEALDFALQHFDTTYITHIPKSAFNPTFHPKIYLFSGHSKSIVYLGSNNLTVGGTETNSESNIKIELALPTDKELHAQFMECWDSCMQIARQLDSKLLKELLSSGMVIDEKGMRKIALINKIRIIKTSKPDFPRISIVAPSAIPFKKMEASQARQTRQELLDEDWIEYAKYLKENTSAGSKLHWKVGNKNDHLEIHIWALKYIAKHPNSSSGELDGYIKIKSRELFPHKTMEGLRALFLSKLLGLLKDSPLEVTKVFKEIEKFGDDFFAKKEFANIITQQLEKLYFWNNIYSLTDRHTEREKRKPINEYFHIYPLFFTYETIINLKENYGYKDLSISRLEFDSFLSLSREHAEIDEVAQRIDTYRKHSKKSKIEKLLKQNSTMDSRFYKILRYNKYFDYEENKITLKLGLYSELKRKVEDFRKLILNDTLIVFDDKNPEEYKNMLYSPKSLLDYHRRAR